MKYLSKYKSPLGIIYLISDGNYLTNLYIEGQKWNNKGDFIINKDLDIFRKCNKWLDIYFKKEIPNFSIPVKYDGTKFEKIVYSVLETIDYGKVITYGEVSEMVFKIMGKDKGCARAVGRAIGRNPISIIIPCHRVIGKKGNLTGYNGGLDLKIKLLKIENII